MEAKAIWQRGAGIAFKRQKVFADEFNNGR